MKALNLRRLELAIALCAFAATAFAASAICVSNTNDAGAGSFRAAITQANEAGGGEITFCIRNSITNTITLLSALPSLTNITITGPGTNLLTISGNNQVQVFSMNAGTTNTLSDLTIANGMLSDNSPLFVYGGGISNAGSLLLLNCSVSNCAIAWGAGGGIYNVGQLVMQHCLVADCGSPNWASYSGGILHGGGIANDGNLSMESCTVTACEMDNGGGIANRGTLVLTNCMITSCSTAPESDGGGIETYGSLTAFSCIISNCLGMWAGGGIVIQGGSVALTNCALVNNRAVEMGGGGVGYDYAYPVEVLSVTMYGCTIADNQSDGIGGGGGVLLNIGTNLTLINCTVSGNEAVVGNQGGGGGIAGAACLNHCTIVSNAAINELTGTPIMGGGVSGNIQSENSIFAGNGSNDISGVFTSMGYNLIENTNGCTITGNPTGDIYGADPLLGPLQNNGGPTWTHALLPGSPAIDQACSGGLTTDQRGMPRPYDVPCIPNACDGSDIGAYEWTPSSNMLPPGYTPGGLLVSFAGIVGRTYSVQRAPAVTGPWVSIGAANVGPTGIGSLQDTNPPLGSAFYRTAFP
jgi:hypothetical protein